MPVLKIMNNGVWEDVAGVSGHTHSMSEIYDFPQDLLDEFKNMQENIGDTSVSDQIESAIAGKSDIGHTHNQYALTSDVSSLRENITDQISVAIGGITHPIKSVNGKTGVVSLTASDVGALPSDTEIPSTAGLASETFVNNAVVNKVDKVSGKGLSTNDYTTAEKNKLEAIEAGANKTVVDGSLDSTSTNPVQNRAVHAVVSDLQNKVGDDTVANQIAAAIAAFKTEVLGGRW